VACTKLTDTGVGDVGGGPGAVGQAADGEVGVEAVVHQRPELLPKGAARVPAINNDFIHF
jgi:hypothetical protein